MVGDQPFHFVREHIPLEQGLRHDIRRSKRRVNAVREHIPLEQGLRHFFYLCINKIKQESESIFH